MDVDKLVALANYLDEIGLKVEADFIDQLIVEAKEQENSDEISDEVVKIDNTHQGV
jgi:hypothetical protein